MSDIEENEMNVVIVEDCKEHSELLKSYIEAWSANSGQKVSVAVYEDGEKFLFHIEDTKDIDAVFLDIQMPGITGVELARKLRGSHKELAIIFTTGIDDYMEEGYELEAIHYLMKPIRAEKVALCLDKVCRKAMQKEEYLVVNSGEDIFKVAHSKIWWLSAMGHYTILAVQENDGTIKRMDARNSIGEMEKQLLTNPMFQKSHRSYIVNLAHVKSIAKTDVVMDNQDKIPLSRRMYQQVNEGFIRFYTMEKKESK